jgi:ABC-2 type transport system ATP-binding protein
MLDRAAEATVFLSSHDLAEVESFASHVGYLDQGRLLFSEEMASLSKRFREVELTLGAPAAQPERWPETWIRFEIAGTVVRFVDSAFDDVRTSQQIASLFSELRDVTVRPMSLRSIFVAMARTNDTRRKEATA